MENRPTILIVDDEPFNLDTLEQELEDLDYRVIPAANGKEALQKVASEPVDMVLLDIMMPVMDGFEVLRQLKAEPDWRDIPVVIVSAMTDMENVVRGIQMGADDYLPKPFNPTLLEARLQAGLARKRLRDLEKIQLHSLERELEIGHEIQAGFLPRRLPDIPGWDLAAYLQPAREVAGDFYDVFSLPGKRTGFFLGDVTDKGVGAALFMALYRTLLRALLSALVSESSQRWTDDPAGCVSQVLAHANNYVCTVHEDALFASLFVGVLEPDSGRLVWANAGHNPPSLINNGSIRARLAPTGPILGVFPHQEFPTREHLLDSGDTLLIHSDGFEDAMDAENQFLGLQRLQALIQHPTDTAAGLIDHIVQGVQSFSGVECQYDDLTLLAVRRL